MVGEQTLLNQLSGLFVRNDILHVSPGVSYLNFTGSSLSNIRPFGLAPMLPWTTLHKYFRYHGSLTIPGCQESVTWTLFKESVKISSEQMKSLRNLTNASGKQLVNNYRPVQPLNKRTVKNSFLPPSCPVIRSTSIIIDINAGLFSLMLLSALFGH